LAQIRPTKEAAVVVSMRDEGIVLGKRAANGSARPIGIETCRRVCCLLANNPSRQHVTVVRINSCIVTIGVGLLACQTSCWESLLVDMRFVLDSISLDLLGFAWFAGLWRTPQASWPPVL
jgi:hypothetical protein